MSVIETAKTASSARYSNQVFMYESGTSAKCHVRFNHLGFSPSSLLLFFNRGQLLFNKHLFKKGLQSKFIIKAK